MQEYKDAMDRISNEMRGRMGEKTLAPLLTITIAAGGPEDEDEKDEGQEPDGDEGGAGGGGGSPLEKALAGLGAKGG